MNNRAICAGLFLTILVFGAGCTTQDRMIFGDGVAALTGRAGEVARGDVLPSTRQLAAELQPQQPAPEWATTLPEEAVDFSLYLDMDRLLVGTAESGAYLGIPDFRTLILYDVRNGSEIWRSDRPELRNGSYRVLATEPLIVLAGSNQSDLYLAGYDPGTGVKQWERRFSDPFRFMVQRNRLLVAGFRKQDWHLTLLDVLNGEPLWEITVATTAPGDTPRQVKMTEDDVLLVGSAIQSLRLTDGSAHWAYAPSRPLQALDLYPLGERVLLVGLDSLVMLDAAQGKVLWQREISGSPIRVSALTGTHLYLLRGEKTLLDGPGQDNPGENLVEAFDVQNGKSLWRYDLPQRGASALLVQEQGVYLSTRDRIVGLDSVSGKKLFQRTLPVDMVAASPTDAAFAGQPDLIVPHRDAIILARALFGVAAFSARDGKKLWVQPHYLAPLQNPYTADQQVNVFQQTLKLYGYLPANQKRQSTLSQQDIRLQPSLILQSMQRSADSAIARANRTLMNSRTTMLGSRLAHSSKITAIEGNIIAERMAMVREQIESLNNFMLSYYDLMEALGEALKHQAQQGLFERLRMKMSVSSFARGDAFHGDYYLWPFQERGRGLTIIDLNTGKRNDLIFAPLVPPLTELGLDLPTYAVSPAGDQLITFGVSLNPSSYEDYVKWKWRIPRASTLAYDLSQFKFDEKSTTEAYWQEHLKTDLVEWAMRGDLAMVRELIANGVDVNQERYTITPLWAAIFRGHEAVVRELVDHGANVNWEHTMMRLRPLQMAQNIGASPVIIQILKQAGASGN